MLGATERALAKSGSGGGRISAANDLLMVKVGGLLS